MKEPLKHPFNYTLLFVACQKVKLVKDIERLKELDLWVSVAIILFTALLAAAVVFYRSSFSFSVVSLPLTHLLTLIGGLWIAFVTPIYVVLLHRRPVKIKTWIRLHLYGNLVAFALISVHFTYWIINVSFLGTGTALFLSVLLLVATGLFQRFNIAPGSRLQIKFLHVSMTTAFYLILTIHILSHLIRI